MRDVLLNCGDIQKDSSGNFIVINSNEELFQRAYISSVVKKGSFIYDRNLGSCLSKSSDKTNKDKLSMIVNEALVNCGGVYAQVTDTESTITVKFTYEDDCKESEIKI